MKKIYTLLFVIALAWTSCHAQRFTDALDRGVVAVQVDTGNFVSWRRLGEEYYDVTYKLFRNGTFVANVNTTHYYDKEGDTSSLYSVSAVVRGTEQAQSPNAKPWKRYDYSSAYATINGYLDITLENVYDRQGNNVTSHYSPNDAEMADLDGDGKLEIIIKRLNTYDAQNLYPTSNDKEFVVIEAYKVDWSNGNATRMWWIDCGPNMVSLNSTEIDVIAYDWDMDGCAEVVLRGADDMVIHHKNGTRLIGTNDNYRNDIDRTGGADHAWTRTGPEYLIYMDGTTGEPFQVMDYPIPRESADAWGYGLGHPTNDSYGHRSSKYFFGAPYLDGRKPSLFLARGIYGRHRMKAYDIDPDTHTLTEIWDWECNTPETPWYGNGYHNFVVADVDEDGRDEIVYGSMVIDDNGNGLSTTAFGHGDSQHVSDFDPYRKGLEFMGCLEEARGGRGSNYRNATTSEIYRKVDLNDDDGRCLMANFSNDYPGSMGRSLAVGMFSSVSDTDIPGYDGDRFIDWSDLNFRIYWDGDLLSEILDSPGNGREAMILKPGVGRLLESSGCNMNNESKNNPCFQGDILGDWREEIVVRCGTNLRVYTTTINTSHDIYTLWHDHQYRQAMAWQMMAYNQPPHLSFFLGEMEGITMAPPPLNNRGRTILANGTTIGSSYDNQHIMACETSDMTLTVSEGASPYIFTDNAPSHVQGHNDNTNISTT